MKQQLLRRILSLVLAAAMIAGMLPAVSAEEAKVRWTESDQVIDLDLTDRLVDETGQEDAYKPTDTVRVSIVLEDKPTVQAGFSTIAIGRNAEAMAYNSDLQRKQETMARTISAQALEGEKLDVVWNITLVGNVISANVPYGKLDAIAKVAGVQSVCIEQRYEPNEVTKSETAEPMMHSSTGMTGANTVWADGYTGAGSRVAIIDTGTDTDHQSFDNGAYLYALAENAEAAGMTVEEYTASLDLLDAEEIASVLEYLNVTERSSGLTAEDLYLGEKLAFAYNYVDYDLDVTHDQDGQGEHGSHVAGIAAANRYIPQGEGYADALEAVFAAGAAPDAQIITMKVFGKYGGAYESDYMAAIEDAILLGADAVNLSLGSGNPGSACNDIYQDFLDYLATTGTVVVMSAGNSGAWATNAWTGGYLYNDGVSFDTAGSPGTYANSLSVASVDNTGSVGYYFAAAGEKVVYAEVTDYGNAPLAGLDTSEGGSGTEYEYIFIDGIGTESDYAGLDLTGKVVFCSRGTTSFFEKANLAASLGAAAVVIYNNAPGDMYLNLAGYNYSAPVVAIRQSQGAAIKAGSTEVTAGGVTCYTGTMTIHNAMGAVNNETEYYTMSSFSSWGVPGNLTMKPEITAPGGNIWSVYGSTPYGGGSDQYELMSGTSMAAPQITGLTALVAQYIREENLLPEGLTARHLAQSLLMSTAQPLVEEDSGSYYSILNQGAGLARADLATSAESYILVEGQSDGKVKAELGDDPERKGVYTFAFSINNLSGEAMDYALSADVFTQDVFDGGDGTLYLDTWTAGLDANVRFTAEGGAVLADGSGLDCDLNGDGVTDRLDADYLLEYLMGNAETLHADGDVNRDGAVNTFDAHVLLSLAAGKDCVSVPANGSVTIEVELRLTADAKAYLDTYYPAGAYVEAFVHAEPVSDEEGILGVPHSIPVLGYYGSWTDGSMFDIGSYAEFQSGTEQRTPYMYGLGYGLSGENRVNGDYLTIDYGDGKEAYWGGNPICEEDAYLPRRNAMNNANGGKIWRFGDTLIRNAADTRIVMANADTGEIYRDETLGELDAAYYYANEGTWYNYRFQLNLNWYGTDSQGNLLPEGTTVDFAFAAAPEYYRVENEDGTWSIDWDALGDGAWERTQITIDNTAPTIQDIDLKLMEGNVLEVTALDNQYVAAVALLNAKGSAILASAPANQTEENTEITARLDLSGVYGSHFLVAVYDYAMNYTAYEVELELRGERPYFTILENPMSGSEYLWKGYDAEEGTEAAILGRLVTDSTPAAVEYVEGYVFTVTGVFDDFKLQVASDDDLEVFYEAELDPSGALMLLGVYDLAYNAADGRLYTLVSQIENFWGRPYLAVIDMELGTLECIGEVGAGLSTLACDGNGNFYGVSGSDLYTFTLDTYTAPTLVGSTAPYAGSLMSWGNMTWDDNTGKLYWITYLDSAHYLLELDPATAAVTVVRTLPEYTAGLFIRPGDKESIFAPTDEVHSIQLDATAETLLHNSVQLEAVVKPWTVSDDSVTWYSADESIATVDANGRVTGVGIGTTTITAASVLDPGKAASCTVTVTSLNKDLNALVWDEEGQVWWSEFNTDALPAYTKLTDAPSEQSFVSATQLPDGTIYAATLSSDLTSELYTVDPATFETELVGASDIGYFDLAWAPNLGTSGMLLSVYGTYVVIVDPATGNYAGAFEWSPDANLVGIAYCETVMNYTYYEYVDYYYLIDAAGNVYKEGFMDIDGIYYYYDGPERGFMINLDHKVTTPYYHSAYYDAATHYLYWTAYSEENNNVDLMVCHMQNGNIYHIGSFADGVWPVAGLMELNTAAEASVDTMEATAIEMPLVSAKHLSRGAVKAGTNRVSGIEKQEATVKHTAETVTLDVAVPAGSTNGTVTVQYDPAHMTLTEVTGLTDAFAWAAGEGTVEIAYASAKALTGPAAKLTFVPTGAANETTLTLTQGECGDGLSGAEQTVAVDLARACPSAAFTDLDPDAWYHEAVDFVLNEGLMNGMSDTIFAPGADMNRAQLVTILYRLAGSPAVESSVPFEDVEEGSWFADAVAWAAENGIANGVSETHFAPGNPVTREQMVTFLARYAACNGMEISGGDLSGYTDADTISAYALEAFSWAVETGLVKGVTADTLQPHAATNRAQIATILMRYCALVG